MAAAFADFGPRCEVAILTVQDRDRGEQLCAVTTDPRVTTDAMRQAIRDHGLPNLAVPRYVRTVPEIPRLGTGKVNYRELERQISLPD
jgi:acyl-[acyl-carrier-protein]-phospholipid O-acyltransferase/long-chain-fatty-acid--[acyl-carrier-protein] ligase